MGSPFAQVTIKPREPPFFRGDLNEDLHAWVSALRDYLFLLGASEAQSVAYAATLLQGQARIWWDQYLLENHHKRPQSLDIFLAALEGRFLSPMYSKEARMKLWTIAQRKDETVHAFSGRFQTLLARLPHYDEEDMLERYIRALHPQLRMPVAQREPQTLSECIRLASHLELLTGTYMGRSTGPSEPQAQGRGQSQNRGRGRTFRAPRQQQQQPRQQQPQQQQMQPRGRGRGGWQQRGGGPGPQCTQCGGWGHFWQQCPMRVRAPGRGGYQAPRGQGGQFGGRGQAGRGQPARLQALAGEDVPVVGQHPLAHPQAQPYRQGNA